MRLLSKLIGNMEFKGNGIICSGKPKLINIKNYQSSTSNYAIACDVYKLNDKHHRYIKVDPAIYDLLNCNVAMEEQEPLKDCKPIISRNSEQKICDIHPNELVIIKDQAKLVHTFESIQIDLTFKRNKENINEFEINSYNTKHKLILSYTRVYTNVITTEGYQQLFTVLFNVIKNLIGSEVNFKHINRKGIGCIIGDLDAAQAKGLGLFLQSKDSQRNWETHLKVILKSCVIHFERNARTKKFSSETLKLISNIPIASSLNELETIFQTLEQVEDPKIKAAHALANREGKQLKLLTAIIRGHKVDQKA
ncbi:hypothetical protein GLOIN_2v1545568 [Rhizophagus clarus]|uniref:Uncharacterized protein n=1 Tax=Rhizophagus clarus TaxID=94130 RepID=A0A8H3MIV5_9GLOM|nr:hypothetical protein GLOIN_2v1545568 [Rhizophagus clarus]